MRKRKLHEDALIVSTTKESKEKQWIHCRSIEKDHSDGLPTGR